jgi:hypothetical protein
MIILGEISHHKRMKERKRRVVMARGWEFLFNGDQASICDNEKVLEDSNVCNATKLYT